MKQARVKRRVIGRLMSAGAWMVDPCLPKFEAVNDGFSPEAARARGLVWPLDKAAESETARASGLPCPADDNFEACPPPSSLSDPELIGTPGSEAGSEADEPKAAAAAAPPDEDGSAATAAEAKTFLLLRPNAEPTKKVDLMLRCAASLFSSSANGPGSSPLSKHSNNRAARYVPV